MKAYLSKLFARRVIGKIKKENRRAVELQLSWMNRLLNDARKTAFGLDHSFDEIKSYEDFVKKVPIRDYESLKSYVERIQEGEKDVLWPGLPVYLSKTSGTTSGAKYIPITKESVPNHIETARNALLSYIYETGKTDFVNGKMIFLQGSPEMTSKHGMFIGRLSGIVAHHVPSYLLRNRLPSYEINIIDDWEEKVRAIVDETLQHNMTLISGIPPWVQMYFEYLIDKSGKQSIAEIFPNFSLLVYGGVNYKPYQQKIDHLIGKKIDSIEVYPASEGFIAYQDEQNVEGMLLNTNSGIFFEFVKAEEIFDDEPKRLHLGQVELNTNYVVIINSNAGLWGYNIGDTIKFVSIDPYRIVVTGRVKHYTSAFGEHVIAEEVEGAAAAVSEQVGVEISEFHVAPKVNPDEGLPHHQWYIEFEDIPESMAKIATALDDYMQNRNPYYKDLREGNILKELEVCPVKSGGFNEYMKSIGKLGGQNKLPRLSNDRKLADAMSEYAINE